MKTVELRTAYQWWCDNCGIPNFALPQKLEMNNDDREECFREFHGLDDYQELPPNWRDFEMVCIPDEVECASCHERFATSDERDADEIE